MKDPHFTALENMYLSAPINDFYPPRIEIGEGEARIELEIAPKYFHAVGAVHGSVYFKLLDDAAFFAANSLEREVFLLTTSFTTYMTRPISSGVLCAEGRILHRNKSQFIAEAVAYDSEDRQIGRGSGLFVRAKSALRDVPGYRSGAE